MLSLTSGPGISSSQAQEIFSSAPGAGASGGISISAYSSSGSAISFNGFDSGFFGFSASVRSGSRAVDNLLIGGGEMLVESYQSSRRPWLDTVLDPFNWIGQIDTLMGFGMMALHPAATYASIKADYIESFKDAEATQKTIGYIGAAAFLVELTEGGAAEVPEEAILWRGGPVKTKNLTPRPIDHGLLSFRSTLSNPYPKGERAVLRPGEPYFGIDSRKLPPGSLVYDETPGHVMVKDIPPDLIEKAIVRTGKFPK